MKWLLICLSCSSLFASSSLLPCTNGDPDGMVQGVLSTITGEFCDRCIDLSIVAPDALILERHYTNKNFITGQDKGGWRIFPQIHLVIGQDPHNKTCKVRGETFEWTHAYTGERSGSIHTYSGWVSQAGNTKDPLKIDPKTDAIGMVNTWSSELSGQVDPLNNQLHLFENHSELTLGDGTKRYYQKINRLPDCLFGEELTQTMASKVVNPRFYRLTKELLPSQNSLHFAYDEEGHLLQVTLKNTLETKVLAWIRFEYSFEENASTITAYSSDERQVRYDFDNNSHLLRVESLHNGVETYTYHSDLLRQKCSSDGQTLQIQYNEQKQVTSLDTPFGRYHINYAKGCTEIIDPKGVKSCYIFDDRLRLTQREQYDELGQLYRIDQKYYGNKKDRLSRISAKTVKNGSGDVLSHRAFTYDNNGNVIEDRLHGNLTGKGTYNLQVDVDGTLLNPLSEECHLQTFGYSKDGFNLLTSVGDAKGNHTEYNYEKNTNKLYSKLIFKQQEIKKRTFHFYNEDAVCIQTINDDSNDKDPRKLYGCSTRFVTYISPKSELPGVGLALETLEKGFNLKTKQEDLIKRCINTYSAQGKLLTCSTYGSDNTLAYTVSKTFNEKGQTLSETGPNGETLTYQYDQRGNQTHIEIPHGNKTIVKRYNQQNLLIEKVENDRIERYKYDDFGRKIQCRDYLGNTTHYDYDAFGRLTKIQHPTVSGKRPIFTYRYDIFGNVISICDPNGHITTKNYNLRKDPTQITYPDNTFELFKYDPEGSLHRTRTREGLITIYEYDYLGRLDHEETSAEQGTASFLKHTTYWYNGFNLIKIKEDPLTTVYTYDHFGRCRKVKISDPNNQTNEHTKEFSYDALGRQDSIKEWHNTGDKDFSIEKNTYNLLNQLIQKRIENADSETLYLKDFTYNAFNQPLKEKTKLNGCEVTLNETTYNAHGEIIALTDSAGGQSHITYEQSSNNLIKKITNPLGLQTTLTIDPLGRVISLQKYNSSRQLLAQIDTTYDLLGNKTEEREAIISDGIIQGMQKTGWEYGPMGRIDTLIENVGTPDEKSTHYSYNEYGQVQEIRHSKTAAPLQYSYDIFGRLEEVRYEAKNQPRLLHRYHYNFKGQLIKATTQDGVIVERKYTNFNQLSQETIKYNNHQTTLDYTYDQKNRLTSITLPDNSQIAYTYDALYGREVKRLNAFNEEEYSHSYTNYDVLGNLLQETCIGYCGEQTTNYKNGTLKQSIQTDFYLEALTYNPLGHVTAVEKEAEFPYHNQQFCYNDLAQLTTENDITYSPNAIQHKKDPSIILDILSKPITIQTLEGNVQFIYDPFGRKIATRTPNNKTIYHFYYGYNHLGTDNQLRIPGLHGAALSTTCIAVELDQNTFVPLHDHAGNLIALIDPSSREIIESYTYTAFGEEQIYNDLGQPIANSAIGNPWRYQSKPIDENTHFIDFGLRHYNPKQGTWISPDPAGFIDGPNRYTYCQNNPISSHDRYGLATTRNSSKDTTYFYGEVEDHCYCEVHRTCKRGGDLHATNKDRIPRISYNNAWEVLRSTVTYLDPLGPIPRAPTVTYQPSSIYETGGHEEPNLGIGFINGIWNDYEGATQNAYYVSKLAGGYNVYGTYNATHGHITDMQEYLINKALTATEPVKQLHQMWNSFFEKSDQNARFLMICHSQGVAHVRNALLDYPPELRERIYVLAIAPGAYIYQETCAQVTHYRAASIWRDFVPHLDQKGAKREKETIIELTSHPRAPHFDHPFQSPTYRGNLSQDINNFLQMEINQ